VDALGRRRTAPPQVATRARIVLLAAAGLPNRQLARPLGLEVATVRLRSPPRRSARSWPWPVKPPRQAGRPISPWSNREIADQIIRRGIRPTMSPRPAGRLLTRGS